MNFLYCFDSKFNLQALNSIMSIIKNNKNKEIKIFVIHDNPNSFKKLVNEYLNEYKEIFEIFEFKFDYLNFPKLYKSHVSKATYFRLFFQEYIPKEVNFLTYVDSDIICISDFYSKIDEKINEIKKEKFLLGAVTESSGGSNKERLELSNDNYFNAGVMILNMNEWNKKITIENIINRMNTLGDKILWWDQDILNSLVDGNYLAIEEKFNKQVGNIKNIPDKDDIFIHYSGKGKPWAVSFFRDNINNVYQKNFRNTNIAFYHLETSKLIENLIFLKNLIIGNYKKYDNKKVLKSFIKIKKI